MDATDLDLQLSNALTNLSVDSKSKVGRLLVVCPLETYVGSELTAFRCILVVSNFVRLLESLYGYTCSIFGFTNSFNIECPHFDSFKMANIDECEQKYVLERLKVLASIDKCSCGTADLCVDATKLCFTEKFVKNIRHCVIRTNSCDSSLSVESMFVSRLVAFCEKNGISTVLSVFPENHQHFFGNIQVLSRLLNVELKFIPFSVGIVKCQSETPVLGKDLMQIRKVQLLEVYKRKNPLENVLSEKSLNSLLWTCVSFEFLTKSINKPLLLSNLSVDLLLPETSGSGLKIVYNYARIYRIIDKFNERVDQGIYLPMAPLTKLSQNSKSKVQDATKELFDALNEANDGNVDLEKLTPCCCRLMDFTRKFSKFYRRNQILVDPSPTLMESLYVKMHVLLYFKKCLEIYFDSLCIDPVKQM